MDMHTQYTRSFCVVLQVVVRAEENGEKVEHCRGNWGMIMHIYWGIYYREGKGGQGESICRNVTYRRVSGS